MKTLILTLLMTQAAHAEWFCTSQISEISKDEFKVCGMFYGKTEDEARQMAFVDATNMFNRICNASSPSKCMLRTYTAVPSRTECEPAKHPDWKDVHFKCYQLVRFVFDD